MKKPFKQQEKEIQKTILDHLRLRGHVAFKFPSVGIYKRATDSYIPQPQKGIADIIGFQKNTGRGFALEVKSGNNKPSDDQLIFLGQVERVGGIQGVVRTVEDVKKLGL